MNSQFFAALFLDPAHPIPYFVARLRSDDINEAISTMEATASLAFLQEWNRQHMPITDMSAARIEPDELEEIESRTIREFYEAKERYENGPADKNGPYPHRVNFLLRIYTEAYYDQVHNQHREATDPAVLRLEDEIIILLAELRETR